MNLNTTLIRQHASRITQLVQEGKAAELREQDGYTNKVLIEDAKKILGLGESDLISAEFEQHMKDLNKKGNALISIVNTKNTLKDLGYEESLLKSLEESEKKLAKEIAVVYDLEVEDLYEEESK